MSRLIRFFVSPLVLFLYLTALIVPSAAAYPSISGECACAYIPALDRFVYEKKADKRHPMASTTKIMTALVVLEKTEPQEKIAVAPAATGIEGSSVYLKAGEVQTAENLLYAILLESANDAAAAMAIHIAGSIDGFAELMNERAADLGLTDTHFTNPHGLADPAHYTTAADLARIAAAAMENETFRTIVATKKKVISAADGKTTRTLSNHNRLLSSYEDCIGIKTGFTKASGRCLVSAAERDGMLLIAVTLDAPNDWHDHAAMLDYGFSQYGAYTPRDLQKLSLTIPVIGGTAAEVTLSAGHAPTLILEKAAEPPQLTWEVNRFAVAPIKRGDVLGLARYTQNGKTIATVPLLADASVAPIPRKDTIWDKIKSIWKN